MKKYTLLFTILATLGACKKPQVLPGSVPVKFTATTYQTLGTYDNSGKPSYLTTKDVISSDLLSFINNTLHEKQDIRKTHQELFSTSAIADIKVTQKSDVYVTYVYNNTGYTDAIAFYTYPTNNPPASAADIKTITYIYPNAGNGTTPQATTTLQAGDKVNIGRFDVGTSIGFVLLQGAWNPTTHTINTDSPHFCSNDVLNPETDPNLKKHAVLINYAPEKKVLIGFEDQDRSTPDCDNDFNDVIVYATVTPAI